MNRKCNHCVKSSANGIVKRSNCQLAESNGIVIFIKYTAVFFCFSCAGMANGTDLKIMKSRGTEEGWSAWKSCSG
jgi:hypothetical protein